MVIYDLICSGAHTFEGWFSSRGDFEAQLGQGMIACPLCGSLEVVEKPVAPAVHVGGSRAKKLDAEKRRQLVARSSTDRPVGAGRQTLLRAACNLVRATIEKHFEDVGPAFSDEAVSMYLGDREPRNISGTVTPDEEEELEELGVPFGKIVLPRFDD